VSGATAVGPLWLRLGGPTATTLGYAALGVALGTLTGLVPGLHANAVALGLAALAPRLPGPPVAVGGAMLAAGVAHTFLDVVPSLALGVPDPSNAAGALPGHRLVLAGRGPEALRLSALGSAAGAAAAVPLAVPLTRAARAAVPLLETWLPAVLCLVAGYLVATERSPGAAAAGAVSFAAAAGLGAVVLDLSPSGPLPVGGVLAPLFAGLFGVPVLVESLAGRGAPPAAGESAIRPTPRTVGVTAGAGALAGAVVAYVPGVSAGVAATLALPAAPADRPARGYVVASSAANTATAVFALFALAGLGAARTGVTVALETAGVPVVLPRLLAAVAVAAAAGTVLVVAVGDPYLRAARRADDDRLALAALALLVALAWLFAGVTGLGLLVAAGLVGLLPGRLGCRRVHLMGVLIGPLAVGS
jgi:putative membrane protein